MSSAQTKDVTDEGSDASPEQIREELTRILHSPAFAATPRRRRLLEYIVEEALAGRGEAIKGYAIGINVLERGEDFDPDADPAVRLEVRRLRHDLDGYYATDGRASRLCISIPKGRYVPNFNWQSTAPQQSLGNAQEVLAADAPLREPLLSSTGARPRRSPPMTIVITLAMTVLTLGLVGWLSRSSIQTPISEERTFAPTVAVLQFEALGDTTSSGFLASGISQELVSSLMRFPGFRLYVGRAGGADTAGDANNARELGVRYLVGGSVTVDAQAVNVFSQMIDTTTNEVLWSKTISRPLDPTAIIGAQRELAAEISAELGQPYGVINEAMQSQAASSNVSNMQSYICVLRAFDYRRKFSRELFVPTMECLEQAVQREPNYSDAWAMLGWLHLDAGRFEFNGRDNEQEEYQKALQTANRAFELDPNNTLTLKALSSIYHYLGKFGEAERLIRRAAELNPNDPDTLAQMGWRLAVRGKFDEGIPILKRAIGRTVNPPGWYFHLVAIDLYINKKDYQEMLRISQLSATNGCDGCGVSHLLIAIAAGALGQPAISQQALQSTPERISRDPAAFLRRNGATDEIIDALLTGLNRAKHIASSN